MNSNRSVSLGRRGRLITSISAPMFPAFKPLPKVFLSIAFSLFLAPHAALRFFPLGGGGTRIDRRIASSKLIFDGNVIGFAFGIKL